MTKKISLWEKVRGHVTGYLKMVVLKKYVDQILLCYHDRIMMVVHKYMRQLPSYVVDSEIDDAQDAWDNNNVDGETSAEKITRLGNKPTDITLP